MGWRKNIVALCPYLFLGVILGCLPPLITLRVMSEASGVTSSASETAEVRVHVRNPRAVNMDLSHFGNRGDTVPSPFDKAPAAASSAIKSKPAKVSNEKQRYRPNLDFRTLSSIRSLGFKKKLFIAVMSEESHVSEMSSAAGMTWAGSGNADVHFLYPSHGQSSRADMKDQVTQVPLNVGSSDNDYIRSAAYMCEGTRGRYSWYVLTRDTLYIDTRALTSLLHTLYPDDNIVMGKAKNGECLPDEPIILSSSAVELMCENIHQCTHDNKHDFGACLKEVTQTACVDIAKIKESSLALSGDSKKRLKRIEDDTTLFYTGMTKPDDLYSQHLQIMQKIIQNTKHRLAMLEDELVAVKPNAKKTHNTNYLQDWQGKVDQSTFNSSRPTHKFFDFDGVLVKDNCRVSKNSAKNVFEAAKKVADDKVVLSNNDNNKHKSYGYIQSMSAAEMKYEFYYTERLVKNDKGMQKRVNHVTVGQKYGDLSIESTHSSKVKHTHIFTSVLGKDVKNVDAFLKSAQQACSNLKPFNVGCYVTLLQDHMLTNQDKVDLQDTIYRFKESIRIAETTNPIDINAISLEESEQYMKNISNTNNDILIYIPINVVFDHEFILRCHINVAHNDSLYFPIPFKLLVPQTPWVKRKEFSSSKGFWLTNHFETFCVNMKYFANKSFSFAEFYDEVSAEDGVTLNRYPDPGTFVPWEETDCKTGQFANKETLCFKNFIYKNILST